MGEPGAERSSLEGLEPDPRDFRLFRIALSGMYANGDITFRNRLRRVARDLDSKVVVCLPAATNTSQWTTFVLFAESLFAPSQRLLSPFSPVDIHRGAGHTQEGIVVGCCECRIKVSSALTSP
jgi:hypothetical protein